MRHQLEDYKQKNTSLVRREEVEAIYADLKQQQAAVAQLTKELAKAKAYAESADIKAAHESARADRAERAERLAKERLQEVVAETDRKSAELCRGYEQRINHLSAELVIARQGVSESKAELQKERKLRTIVSDRQIATINRLVAHVGALRSKYENISYAYSAGLTVA
eukprot:SAG31_NODE_3526_length_4156_cov_1.726645_3_plen_167_part_00